MTSSLIHHIVIVGGGSAGWLSACLIAKKHLQSRHIKVTLVESSDIPTVGVGEGTWPTMKQTLHKIGIDENVFIKRCDATFKQGSQFVQWTHAKSNKQEQYYHPFTAPVGHGQFDLSPYWQTVSEKDFAETVSPQPAVCQQGVAPKSRAEKPYQGMLNYGYHLDAGKFAQLLKTHGIEQLNINHVIGTVDKVNQNEQLDISSLLLVDGQEIIGDLFIDCTGFSAKLLGETLGVEFVSKQASLPADSAMAVQVPYASQDADIQCQTISTAQEAGWIWDIGLQTRRGVGYVYSGQYCSDEDAKDTLSRYLNKDKASLTFKKIKFHAGHRAKFWQNNCVAVGLSMGFLEPLEASALMLIETAADYIADNLPVNRGLMDATAQRFNKSFLYRWQRIIDFLKLHYVLSKRSEPFWQQAKELSTASEQLTELLSIWQYRAPSLGDFDSSLEVFPAASYQYVLYGMGFQSDFSAHQHLYADNEKATRLAQVVQQSLQQAMQRLPQHRELLNALVSQAN